MWWKFILFAINHANAFVIGFYSLYWLYYAKNFVYQQFKIVISSLYCIKQFKKVDILIKYFNTLQFIDSGFSNSVCGYSSWLLHIGNLTFCINVMNVYQWAFYLLLWVYYVNKLDYQPRKLFILLFSRTKYRHKLE